MADENEQSQEPAESVSLEDLAKQFETKQEPAQPAVQEPLPTFDSEDDAIKHLAKTTAETRAQLKKLVDDQTRREQESFVAAEMKALDDAIKTIGKEVEGLDPMFIEGALHTAYNRDKNFQKIFDNRDQNPAAYQKALGVITGQIKAKSAMRHDPQLAENQRALEQLQKSSRSGAQTDDDPTAGLSASEFDAYWERLKAG